MAGYGCERHAKGMVAPLLCQALALKDTRGRTLVVLTADILAFDPTTTESIRRTLRKKYGIAPEAVMLAPSHTHWSAPSHYRMNLSAGTTDPWWLKRLEENLLKAANQALKAPSAARVAYTELQAQIGHCRRGYGPDGKVIWAVNPDGFYDEHTPVLIVEKKAAQPSRIVLLSHACHPTSSGGVEKWSPDYPGALRDELSKLLGSHSKVMFGMGCGGDAKVTHTDGKSGKPVFSGAPARAKAAGVKLARAVARHLTHAELHYLSSSIECRLVPGELTFATAHTKSRVDAMAYPDTLDGIDLWWARQAINFPDLRRTLPYTVQAWRLGGELTLLGLEGEVCAGLGPLARSLSRTKHTMIIAYANSVQGYIPTAKIVREGGYEGDTSHRAYFLPAPFTPKVEKEFERIVRRALTASR
jgi:hypothetical protein